MLLPSDTHREPIMPITAVLLPSVTYLLTFPHMLLIYIFCTLQAFENKVLIIIFVPIREKVIGKIAGC
jgi:hypothetical protein